MDKAKEKEFHCGFEATKMYPDMLPVLYIDNFPLLPPEKLRTLPEKRVFRHRHFRLWNPEEAAQYEYVMQLAIDGWLSLRVGPDIRPVPEEHSSVVYIEWVQQYIDATKLSAKK